MPFTIVPQQYLIRESSEPQQLLENIDKNFTNIFLYLESLRKNSTDEVGTIINNNPTFVVNGVGQAFVDSPTIHFFVDLLVPSVSAEVINLSIVEEKIGTLAVTTDKLGNLSVTTAKLSDLSISTDKLIDLAVTTPKLALLSVTTAILDGQSVTTPKIALLAVTTPTIADLAVTTIKLDNLSVSTAKLIDLAVTTAKLDNLSVTTAKLASLAVTTAILDNLAVTTAKIADANVTYAKIQNISATQRILARKSAGSGVVEEASLTEILDFLSTTQGTIFYRGASVWTALAPGTARQFLQTSGTSANPLWADIGVDTTALADATTITPDGSFSINTHTNTQATGTLTVAAPSNFTIAHKKFELIIKSTNIQTFSFNSIYRGSTDLPLTALATTGGGKKDRYLFQYDSTDNKVDLIAMVRGY